MYADQANNPDDLAQPTGSNFSIMDDFTKTGDDRVAVGAREPRTYAGLTAFCDIQPANNAQNIQTEVSKDILEVENRGIATIKRNKHGNTDPSTEERAPGDDESRRQSVDESCVALPGSTSLAHPVSPPPQSRESNRELSSQPKLTVTTSNRGSRSQPLQRSPLRPQNSHVGKRKFPANTSSNESSDESDDSDDRDYLESRTKSQGRKPFSRSTKQARRNSTHVAPARAAYSESLPFSTADASAFEMPEKQAFPRSLQDTETIAVRGFLTRQMFLSRVVYSFTFEEQREQSDMKDLAKAPTASDKEIRKECSKKSKTRKPKANNATTGTRVLREDDRLLIELKEKGDLSWNQIAEHFPGKSKGALQVRYCTRLKNRTTHGSGQTARTQKRPVARRDPSRVPVADDYHRQVSTYPVPQLRSMTVKSPDPNNLPRKRYGPPRARRAIDRYSPI
ncbi:hypothetical protein N7490_006715 [Penicillium lividum]|nr:hypothetical protein N7490_006715 [Penicillium lividum]